MVLMDAVISAVCIHGVRSRTASLNGHGPSMGEKVAGIGSKSNDTTSLSRIYISIPLSLAVQMQNPIKFSVFSGPWLR